MKMDRKPITILIADDDEDDRLWVKEALAESQFASDLQFVKDGEELMDYLYRRGKYALPSHSPHPSLILLDLNMPKKDGREALKEIKAESHLRYIPVVILTTSRAEEDVYQTYDLGANSFIVKPATFEGLVRAMKTLSEYWCEIVALPSERSGG